MLPLAWRIKGWLLCVQSRRGRGAWATPGAARCRSGRAAAPATAAPARTRRTTRRASCRMAPGAVTRAATAPLQARHFTRELSGKECYEFAELL